MGRAKKIVEALTEERARKPHIPHENFVSTGMTQLNLALSGRVDGGVPKGTYVFFVGDSSSGKTWYGLSLMAEAARNPHFDGYNLVYDPSENGALMDVDRFFGRGLADRLLPMCGTKKAPSCSRTVQEFYFYLDAWLDKGPCIVVEDSMDALIPEEEEEVFEAERTLFETGEGKPKGTMGMEKAKYNSRHINRVVKRLQDTGSILFLISQTRDNIGGYGKTHGGGKALKFYSHVQVWTSVKGPIKKTAAGAEREVGSVIKMDVQKNRVSGWEGQLLVPFYRSLGLDDLGACVDWLVAEKHWEGSRNKDTGLCTKVAAPEFNFDGTKDALIQQIEDAEDESTLRQLVGQVWATIEEACKVKRKPRYT